MAAARRGHRGDAPLVRAPDLARALVGGTEGVRVHLHARDDEPPGTRVPGGRRAAGDRSRRLDRGPRRPRPAVDGRVHPARGREACGSRARGARRAADPVRHRTRPPGRARPRPRADGHVSRPRARRLPVADGRRLHEDRPAQRALLQLARARVRGRALPRRPAGRRPRVPVPVLGRDGAGRGGAVPLRHAPASTRTSARPRSCSRSTRRCATWSASATSHRRCPSCAPTHSRCSTRCSSPRPARSGRCSRTAAACGGRPSESTAEKGEEFLAWATRAVVNLVRDMDDVHDQLEPRYLRTRRPRGASR